MDELQDAITSLLEQGYSEWEITLMVRKLSAVTAQKEFQSAMEKIQ